MSTAERNSSERLHPNNSECEEVRQIMLSEAERELSQFENRRIEKHVQECMACSQLLQGGAGFAGVSHDDAWVRAQLTSESNDIDWQQQQNELFAKLGLSSPSVASITPQQNSALAAHTETATPTPPSLVRSLLPVAASLLLGIWFLVNVQSGLTSSTNVESDDFVADVAVLEMAEDQQQIIFDSDTEGEGVLILMISEESDD